jgi:2'-5' RNA ligase
MQPSERTSTPDAAGEGAPPKPARVFVALKIAADIAQELAGLSAEIAGPAVRRVAAADIHLTLVPPWRESSIPDAVAKLTRVVAAHAPFELAFRHVGYGPQPRRPRFLWAECTPNAGLAELRTALLAAFAQTDERPFRPHVTLARIRGNGAAIARKHRLNRELVLSQRIVSVQLMQSPPTGGNGYTVLASPPLGAAAPPAEQAAASG